MESGKLVSHLNSDSVAKLKGCEVYLMDLELKQLWGLLSRLKVLSYSK